MDLYNTITYELELLGIDVWACLYDLKGEADGSLTLNEAFDCQNESWTGTNWNGYLFEGSYN